MVQASLAALVASVWQASLPGDKVGSLLLSMKRAAVAAVPRVPESSFSFQRSLMCGQIPGDKMVKVL